MPLLFASFAFALVQVGQHSHPLIPAVASLSPGDHVEQISIDGTDRSYILHVPPKYDAKKATPLVLLLHGWTADAKVALLYTNMAAESDKDGFLVASADGLGNPRGWNTGFFNLGGKGADDVKFLSQVIDDAEKKGNVDRHRVYVAGHSNGAMMTYVMGSKLSQKIAAIGVVAGTIGFDQTGDGKLVVDKPAYPVSAIIFHGKQDPMVAYDHGKAMLNKNYSAHDSAAFWAAADGLTLIPSETKNLKNPHVTTTTWSHGPKGVEVELVSIDNGKHDWPGGFSGSGKESSTGVDASAMMWAFFTKHIKATLMS